jgi:DNA-binding transcriptional MerR regulator/methylmalonyl-CoA mutase cobalamin-binding subunit
LSADRAGAPVSIAAVERDTGLAKDTLRVWERRYGFPQPLRDGLGERVYPPEQVEKLRLLKRLMDRGMRPGKLAGLPLEELRRLGQAPEPPAGSVSPSSIATPYWELLRAHDTAGVRRQLHQALLALGLEAFVVDHVAPLNGAVGDAWQHGDISVAQEHVYTEALQLVLRQAIGSIPEPTPGAPRALLATLPQEGHGLGLLMVEALLSLHGCRCVSLGVRVPLDGIVAVAVQTRSDLVGLGFSGSFNPVQAAAALHEMRRQLPTSTMIWAGGSNPALQKRLPAGIAAVADIRLVPALLRDRIQAAGPGPA